MASKLGMRAGLGAGLYLLFGALWIALSDAVLHAWTDDPALLTRMQTYKGWAYVLLTAALAWYLLRANARAQRRVADSEATFRATFELAAVGLAHVRPDGRWLRVNQRLCEILGYTREELTQRTFQDITHPQDLAPDMAQVRRVLAGEISGYDMDKRYLRKDGSVVWAHLTVALVRDEAGAPAYFISAAEDISGRKSAQERVRRLTRVYALLSGINHALLHERAPAALFREACRIAVETGGLRMAWLGLVDEARRAIRPVAHAGVIDGYLEHLHISLGDDPQARGPTGQVARSGLHQVCNDIATDPRMAPWRTHALRLGYRASAAFPIRVGGRLHATFNLYADTPGFFDEEELRLLDELALNVGFALEAADNAARRRAAEAVAQESERRFQTLLANVPYRIFHKDRASVYVSCNEHYAADLGIVPEAIAGCTDLDFHPLDLAEKYRADDQRIMANGEVEVIEEDYVRGGERRAILTTKAPIRDASGEVSGVIGMFLDITERRRMEEALRDSEERFRRAVEDAPFPVLIHAEDGEVLTVNGTWTEITGYAHADMPTVERWTELAYGERGARVRDAIARLYALRAREDEGESTIRCRGGATRVWDFSSAPLGRTPDGRRTVISMAVDVTERKQAEEAMRQRLALQDQLAKVAATVPGAICSFRLAPDGATCFPYVTDAFEDVYGVAQATVRESAEPVFARIHPDDRAPLNQSIADSARDMTPWRAAFRYRHPRKGERWIEGSSVPEREPDGAILWHGFVSDVTERKQAEEDIRSLNAELEARVRERTAQLEAANKELETFAYSASHDLKAPLRGIDGYSRLLQEECAEQLTGDCRTFVENIRQGALQMTTLIDDLLAYARMERKAMQVHALDLGALVAEVVAEHAAEIEAAGARVTTAVPELHVRADRDGLIAVLRNLLGNALKFSRTARPPVVEIGARAQGDSVLLWVRDNGIGFDMRFAERIFEIFQRLQRAEDYPGTGVGLAVVRKAVQRMGGQVRAESEPGAGSTFFVELPS